MDSKLQLILAALKEKGEYLTREQLQESCEHKAHDRKSNHTATGNSCGPLLPSGSPVVSNCWLKGIKDSIHSRNDDAVYVHEYTIDRDSHPASEMEKKSIHQYRSDPA